MLNKSNGKTINTLGYCGSFFIPAIIISVAFVMLGIYPGGRFTPLILDLSSEHFPFYNYLNNSAGLSGLYYQTLGGLGNGIINSLQMYTGPFVFVFALVDPVNIPYAVWLMIIFQIGLGGLAEYFYLKKGYPSLDGVFKPLCLSVCYSLMSCAVVYTIVPVWLWGIIFLPLAMLGMDRIIDKKEIRAFILFLSLSVIFNYLTAYIIVIFSLIYFLYRMVIGETRGKGFGSCFFRYVSGGMISAALTAFSWLPVLLDLFMGKAEENRHPALGFTRNPLHVIGRLFIPGYDGLGRYSLPFVFCGSVPLILFILYFFNRKIDVKKKTAGLAVAFFFILSFSIGALDIPWMFFAEPNGYPSRYSFVLSFFIILIAASEVKIADLAALKKSFFRILVSVYIFVECLIVSASLLSAIRDDVGPYSGYSDYCKAYNAMEEIKSAYAIAEGTDRTVKNWRLTDNDGILFGYSDIDYFSSSYNSRFHEFMGKLGFNTQYHLLRSDGITPVIASVFGVSHLIEYRTDLSAYYEYLGSVDELNVFGNSYSMPLMFSVESDDPSEDMFVSDDPFQNINEFIYDLSGTDGVFDELDHALDNGAATVFVDEGRDLWMYAASDRGSDGDIHGINDSETHYVYYDGIPINAYRNYLSSYCVSLGFGAGDYASFTFDDDELSALYFASVNREKTAEALNVISNNSAYDFNISGSGFDCYMDTDDSKHVLITLPYDKGFNIRDNGKVIDYYPYKGALICFELEEGSHHIEVDYVPSGLVGGIILSSVTLILIVLMNLLSPYGKKKNKKRIDNED